MSHKTLLLIYHCIFNSHELRNNILGKYVSQYTNFWDAKETNQNYYGLWEKRLVQNLIQETEQFATYVTVHTFLIYICS